MTYYRIPHGATQLVEQVQEHRKSAKFEREGEPDGFETIRTISFDKATSTWLEPIVKAMEDDRIQETHMLKGQLHVTFVGDIRADSRDPYALDEADSVLSGE